MTSLLLSAGEASGDMYAARLAAALKQRADLEIFGMGGPQMRAAGVDIVTDYSEVSVVGITEILSHLPSLLRAMRHLVAEAERRKPALAILTDFPGFHLRLARKLKRRGIKNVYYICPQFWAWRPWRVRVVRRRFSQALCIFPFEEKFYGDAGVPVNTHFSASKASIRRKNSSPSSPAAAPPNFASTSRSCAKLACSSIANRPRNSFSPPPPPPTSHPCAKPGRRNSP
jgi:lipid A disaccharide synthetase